MIDGNTMIIPNIIHIPFAVGSSDSHNPSQGAIGITIASDSPV
jgi:hypothetical protein